MCDKDARAAGKARYSTQGSVAVLVALTLTMLIGFTALGTEIVYALFKQRQMQATASSAALAGATASMTGYPVPYTIEAYAVAATMGFTSGTGGTTVTINHPPLSGNYTASAIAVEVIVAQPQSLPLSELFFAGPWNISARAVATEGNSASDCVLELDGSSAGAVTIDNGATVNLNQCGLAVSATGSGALTVVHGATLTAASVTVSGTDTVNNGGAIHATNGVQTSKPAVANPYSSSVVPSDAGCATYTNKSQSLSPGVYCGMAIGNGVTVTMSPGVYVINGSSGGEFSVSGGSKLSGTGVTIVLTGSGSNYATVSISNGARVTLSAPTTGATAGLVFFADPNSPSSPGSSFAGGSEMTLTGALYFPSQTVSYSNAASTSSTCTQLVAWHVSFVGGSAFDSTCASAGTSTIGATPSLLVE